MSLDLYIGAQATFAFDVDDPDTIGIDDLSAVDWVLRILGADDECVEVDGTYDTQVVTVTVDAATSDGIAEGLYQVYVVALQTGVDEIMAGDDILRAHTYPPDPAAVS